MSKPLRVLIVEDSPDDAELVALELKHGGYNPIYERVDTAKDMRAALDKIWDIVIADYKMPQFNALEALALLRETGLDLPFIVVSGAIGEDIAVAAMKAGAHDYLMKDNLTRLVPAIEREIRDARIRRERKRAQEQLLKLSSVVKQSPSTVVITDTNGDIEYVNPKFTELTGYNSEEVIGKNPRILKSGETPLDEYKRLWDTITSGKDWRGEFHNKKKEGTLYWEDASISSVKNSEGVITHFIKVAKDITARKQAEEALRKSKASLAEAQRIAHLGNWDWDIEKNGLYWSDEIYRIFGLAPQKFGATYEAFLSSVHPDDREFVKESVNKALYEKKPYNIDHRIVLPNGKVRIVHEQAEIFSGKNNKPIRMVGTVQDITERKQIEQMKSDFVSLVSHQLKTPVGEINAYIDNMLTGVTGSLTAKQKQYLQEMLEISSKNYLLINDLLNVSRIERGVISINIRSVKVREIADLAIRDYRKKIKEKGLALNLEGMDNGITVLADSGKMVEALRNVIDNAVKFTDVGSITVNTKKRNGFGIVEVVDTGKGISRDLLKRLFSKNQILNGSPTPEGGCGLGLYIAKQFMVLQHGDISATSVVEKGSSFVFKIPLTKVKGGKNER